MARKAEGRTKEKGNKGGKGLEEWRARIVVGGCVTTLRLLHRRAKTFRESYNSSSRPEYLIVSLGKEKKVCSNQDRRPTLGKKYNSLGP